MVLARAWGRPALSTLTELCVPCALSERSQVCRTNAKHWSHSASHGANRTRNTAAPHRLAAYSPPQRAPSTTAAACSPTAQTCTHGSICRTLSIPSHYPHVCYRFSPAQFFTSSTVTSLPTSRIRLASNAAGAGCADMPKRRVWVTCVPLQKHPSPSGQLHHLVDPSLGAE